MTHDRLETLGQLLGCYFHQDWPSEFDSDEVAIQAIVDSEPKEKVLAGVREIDALLAASLSDAEIRTLMIETAGCYFDPGSVGMSYSEWLMRVRQKFAHP